MIGFCCPLSQLLPPRVWLCLRCALVPNLAPYHCRNPLACSPLSLVCQLCLVSVLLSCLIGAFTKTAQAINCSFQHNYNCIAVMHHFKKSSSLLNFCYYYFAAILLYIIICRYYFHDYMQACFFNEATVLSLNGVLSLENKLFYCLLFLLD